MAQCKGSCKRNGGVFYCLRDSGHKGIHMMESGDPMDFGIHGGSEVVDDVEKALAASRKRLGVEP